MATKKQPPMVSATLQAVSYLPVTMNTHTQSRVLSIDAPSMVLTNLVSPFIPIAIKTGMLVDPRAEHMALSQKVPHDVRPVGVTNARSFLVTVRCAILLREHAGSKLVVDSQHTGPEALPLQCATVPRPILWWRGALGNGQCCVIHPPSGPYAIPVPR
jgi:hypothetical protein